MYKQTISSTNFSYGEISPNLFGRGDLSAHKGGAMKISNMSVIATGGIRRRDGLLYIDQIPDGGKLIAFEYSASKVFLLLFSEYSISVYDYDGAKVHEFTSPYPLASLSKIRWGQKGNELFLANPDIAPKVIRYGEATGEWSISNWAYKTHPEHGYSCQPFARFPDAEGISITPSGTNGAITLSASKPFFDDRYIGVMLSMNGGDVEIDSASSPTSASAVVKAALDGAEECRDWQEQAFSKPRGYPTSLTFHQNRLVIGGSRSITNRLWFSKTGDYMNFDLGEGLDDEAIEFDMLSDKVNEILCVFSGRHLQVFTSDAEWMVSGSPLTPSSVLVKQQTKIGSVADRFIQPKLVEGSTIFIARNKREIREFFYGDVTESYSSEDLILLSSHLMADPVEQDYNPKARTLYVAQGDGSLSVLSLNKSIGLNAWVKYETQGEFVSLAVVIDKAYAIVRRGQSHFLERFEEGVFADCAKRFEYETATDEIGGLSHLEGRRASVNAEDYAFEAAVIDGKAKLPRAARRGYAGLPYQHLLCPLPVLVGGRHPPKAVRLIELTARVAGTPLLQIDTNGGPRNITALSLNGGAKLDSTLAPFSGDLRVKSKGFVRNFEAPLWKIQGSKPYNVEILNVSTIVESVR